jgi:hypothetical protein
MTGITSCTSPGYRPCSAYRLTRALNGHDLFKCGNILTSSLLSLPLMHTIQILLFYLGIAFNQPGNI